MVTMFSSASLRMGFSFVAGCGAGSSAVRSLGADGEVAERHVLVGARLAREAEHALADDVALDLVGAAPDRDEVARQADLVDPSRERGVVAPEGGVRAAEAERRVAQGLEQGRR